MPQLDPVTFLGQFFWLCVVFTALYLTLVKFCLPSIARILKVRECIQTNASVAIDEVESPAIKSANFIVAQKCFANYPDLQFGSQCLSDCNVKFSSQFSASYQKMLVANLIFSKYGRANNMFFAQESLVTKNPANASNVFYCRILQQIK
jgi:hypothetical protein